MEEDIVVKLEAGLQLLVAIDLGELASSFLMRGTGSVPLLARRFRPVTARRNWYWMI